jgi:predicted TPR repeat methyltransferase
MAKRGVLRNMIRGTAAERMVDTGALAVAARTLRGESYQAPRFDEAEQTTQQFAALIHTIWLVFAADQQLDESEVIHLISVIDDITEGEAPSEFVEELFDAYADLYDDVGVDGSVRVISNVLASPELRRIAFKLAVGAVCFDGRVTEQEEDILSTIAASFGYSEAEALMILGEVERQFQ